MYSKQSSARPVSPGNSELEVNSGEKAGNCYRITWNLHEFIPMNSNSK